VTHALVITDAHGERRIPLVGTLVVGRDPGCEIYDPDPLLSRRHAQFVLGARGASVRDLDSRNGIQVNGAAVKEAPLRPGDVVQIAHLRIRYEETMPEPVAPSSAGGDDATVVVADAMMQVEAAAAAAAGPQTGGAEATRVVLPHAMAAAQPVARAPIAAPPPAPPRASAPAPAPAPGRRGKRATKVADASAAEGPAEPHAAGGPWLIRVQIYFAVVAIAAFLIAALPALWWHDSQLGGFAEERASTLANWAAAEARLRIESGRSVGDALDSVLKQPGVVGALVLDPDGRILAPAIRSQEVVQTLDGLGVAPNKVFGNQIGHDADLTIAARPIEARDRPRAAVVWLSVRASDLGARVESSGAVLAPMFIVAVLIGIAMALLLHRSTTRLLGALNEDTELAMGGQLRAVADTLGSAQTRDLTTTLNYLLARVRAGGGDVAAGEEAAQPPPAVRAPAAAPRQVPHASARQQAPAVGRAPASPAAVPAPAAAAPPPPPPPPAVPALPPAQLVASAQLRVTEASEASGVVFGVPRDRALGQHVLDAISEKAVLDAVLKCLSAMPPAGEYEASAVHEGTGKTLHIRVSRAGRDQPVTIEAREEA
jgi:hypothetical protein